MGVLFQDGLADWTVARNIILTLTETADPFSRQRERLTSTYPQLSDSSKTLVLSPRWVLAEPTVGRNITLNLTESQLRVRSRRFQSREILERIQKLSIQLWSVIYIRFVTKPRLANSYRNLYSVKVFVVIHPVPNPLLLVTLTRRRDNTLS
jgi:hypothetical protein